VGGAGVDDAHRGVFDHRDRIARCGIGQAEDGDVAVVERFAPGGGVLSQVGGQGANAKFAAAAQPVLKVKAGGALVAVDEECLVHGARS